MYRIVSLACATILIMGCAAQQELSELTQASSKCMADDGLCIRYFGTGCFLMEYNGKTLLTDPFVSNPKALRSLAGQVSTDTTYVNRYIGPADLRSVRMVISGHAHYDHLMDLPYLSRWMPEHTVICANRTAKHILSSYAMTQQTTVIDSMAADSIRVGEWAYAADSSMRAMAVRSLHPPQIAGMHLMSGSYSADLGERPTRIWDWLQGRTHAFLVDFMEHGKPAYRIYFSSSMAPAPFGLFPHELLEEKSVDVAFLGAAGDHDPDRYPAPILELTSPAKVFLIHWESFFRSKDRKTKAISRKGLLDFHARVKQQVGDDVPIVLTAPMGDY